MSNKDSRRLARRLARLSRTTRGMARGSQAAYRSVEVTDGPVSYYDEDGVQRLAVGPAPDGSFTVVEQSTTPPPQPTPPDVTPVDGGFRIDHDGTFVDENTPLDFAYFEVHLGDTPGYDKTDQTQIGSFVSDSGGSLYVPWNSADSGGWVAIVAVNRSMLESTPSDEVEGFGIEVGGGSGPTEVPPASPELETLGTSDAILLRLVDPIASTTSVVYQISLDYDPLSPGTETWIDLNPNATRETFFLAVDVPGEGLLQEDVTYWFRAVAENAVGAATPGVPAFGQLDPARATERIEARLKAGELTVGRMQFGEGDEAPFWDPDIGISFGPDKTLISSDPDVPSNWVGESIMAFMTMLGGILQGLFDVIGTIKLAVGVSAPKTGPTVTPTWDSLVLDTVLAEPTLLYHLAEKVGDATEWAVLEEDLRAINFYDKTTGAETPGFPVNGDYRAMTKIGSYYYCLGTDLGEYRIRVYDAAGAIALSFFTGIQTFDVVNGDPVLGVDGSGNLMMAWPIGGGDVRVRRYNALTLATVSTNTYDTGSNSTLGGVARGEFDFGAGNERVIIARRSGADPYVFNASTGARDTSSEFARAEGNSLRGLWWDGTRFHSLNGSGRVYSYDTGGVTAITRFAGYSYVSEDGNKETQISPLVEFIRPARAQTTISTPPPPEAGQSGANKANRIGIYYGSVSGAMHQQIELAAGVNSYTIVGPANFAGKAPESANGFTGVSAPGVIQSEAALASDSNPLTRFRGDGQFMLTGSNFYDSGELATNATWGPGYFRFKRIGTIIFVEGYVDRDGDFGTTDTTIGGVTIPVWARPSQNRQVAPTAGYSTNEEYRVSFNADGTVSLQRTGVITTFMKVSAHYDL